MPKGESWCATVCAVVALAITVGAFHACAHTKSVKLEMVRVGLSAGEAKCLLGSVDNGADFVVCDRVFARAPQK